MLRIFCCASSSLTASTEYFTSPPLVSIASYLKVGMASLPSRSAPESALVLDDGLAHHLVDGGQALVDRPHAGLAQGGHALADAGLAQLVGRGARGDHVAQVVVHDH